MRITILVHVHMHVLYHVHINSIDIQHHLVLYDIYVSTKYIYTYGHYVHITIHVWLCVHSMLRLYLASLWSLICTYTLNFTYGLHSKYVAK